MPLQFSRSGTIMITIQPAVGRHCQIQSANPALCNTFAGVLTHCTGVNGTVMRTGDPTACPAHPTRLKTHYSKTPRNISIVNSFFILKHMKTVLLRGPDDSQSSAPRRGRAASDDKIQCSVQRFSNVRAECCRVRGLVGLEGVRHLGTRPHVTKAPHAGQHIIKGCKS